MNAREVARMAIALAAERDWPVFPVTARKTPTIPGKGGHAHASTDPTAIAAMWADHPGPLIGVRTGATSGISVLDIDSYVPSANQWLNANSHRLARTETYETAQGVPFLLRPPAWPSLQRRPARAWRRHQGGRWIRRLVARDRPGTPRPQRPGTMARVVRSGRSDRKPPQMGSLRHRKKDRSVRLLS